VNPVPVRDDLSTLDGYHSPQVQVSVRLNTNESPVAPPAAWVRAFQEAVADIDWHRYPERSAGELRESIAMFHGVRPDQVFAANGSNEVLQTILLAYAGPGRTVVTFEPTYQLHSHIARITGATVVSGDRNADFTLDEAEMRRVVAEADPSVVFLCSPNNPTGLVEPPVRVDALIEVAPGLVVIDEAYAQFSSWSALDRVSDDAAVAVVRTFSKTWGMAAARLGYVVGPAWMVAELEKVALPYHLDAAKQVAGRLALQYVEEMNDRVGGVIAERERVSSAMEDLGVAVFPSGANFVLFRVAAGRGRGVWQGILDHDVLVRDCSSWARLDDCLRVTIGTPSENDAFLGALAAALKEESSGA
jgi:histidinol-phosphate aminotransferase